MEFRKPEAYQPMMILSALWTLQQVSFTAVSKIMKKIEKHKSIYYVNNNIPLFFFTQVLWQLRGNILCSRRI